MHHDLAPASSSESGLRVLFLDHSAALGGAELYLLDLAPAFAPPGKVLLLEEGPFYEKLRAAGIPVEVIAAPEKVRRVVREAGPSSALRAVPGLLRLAWQVARKARAFDLIYANSQKALVVGSLAARMARRPLVWNLHDVLTTAHFSRLNIRLAVTLANQFGRLVIANSEASREAFRQAGGRLPVAVVPNGFDVQRFAPKPPEQIAALRQALGLSPGPVVGLFSRLAPWKGQHVLLEALAQLPEVQALLVGEALFQEEQRYAQQLRERAAQDDLHGRVHFLGFREDVPLLLQLVDVVVHTSIAPEPFGRVIVEGMLARRPVIATRGGGAVEIVRDGETGLLVPPGDVQALAAAIRHLLDHPAQARQLAEAAYQDAHRRFSIEAVRQAVRQVLLQGLSPVR
ncbi:MAG: glycosyltransferase family 4 protein [Rhodothermus sp.]|nr:glycosyltransferase family 4 protein [Rhodothermus sp.]